jgi:hypothetical protein
MGIISTQGFVGRLVANGQQLDLFDDEEILLSDNVTGLFDLGVLPSDFTRQITLPGTKINNAFFEHVYDISIESPFLFATNVKVPCYFDFNGIYLANGYLQLNKVNILANKFIDSYEVTIFGGVSSFARDINRNFLTDLTSSLAQYNHTSSLDNISSSWNGGLFNGTIVYPMAEYGQEIIYNASVTNFGIDEPNGALAVQDYKPAIRIKAVWDAIFNEYGYTYTSSFWQQPWLDNVYMICNNKLRYPIYENIDLETYGLFKISPISGSGGTNVTASAATLVPLQWDNIESNPGGNLASNLVYTIDFNSEIRGELKLEFEVKPLAATGNMPQFSLLIKDANSAVVESTVPLQIINDYLLDIQTYNAGSTRTQKFTLTQQFNSGVIPAGEYTFNLYWEGVPSSANLQVVINPANSVASYLSVTKVNQGGDGEIMDIGQNMPFGTAGIKLIDFITSLQKKFNLVIYPNKTKPREFIVETFNEWYKTGEIKNFNRYINLDKPISITPANNLAVNKLNFGDTLDGDYVSQQFSKETNREFGKSYYIDTDNFFSQGTFEVKTGMASSPLVYVSNTGTSGSTNVTSAGFRAGAFVSTISSTDAVAQSFLQVETEFVAIAAVGVTSPVTTEFDFDPSILGFNNRSVVVGNNVVFTSVAYGTTNTTAQLIKITDSGSVNLYSGSAPIIYNYTVTQSDVSSSVLNFIAQTDSRD